MSKEKKKILRNNLGFIFAKVFAALCGVIPLRWNYFLGELLGGIACRMLIQQRKVALDSLAIAFPDKNLKQRRRIASDFFIFMAQSSFELLHILKNTSQLDNIRIEGEQHLKEALKKNRGVILVTAHLGNFLLMSLKLAKAGFNVHFVRRPMRDKKIGKYLYDLQAKTGVKTIYSYPRKECVGGIIKALRDNEVVILQMDQNFGTGGVWVKFFGKLAATPVGPISLALRTKAALVPAYIYREGMGVHCIKILPEEELILTKDKNETILLNAIKFTRIIEGWVRKCTYQWGWIHKRWKSRPSAKVKKLKFHVEE